MSNLRSSGERTIVSSRTQRTQHRRQPEWPDNEWRALAGQGLSVRYSCLRANGIYFGKDDETIIVLLVGGDKGSQAKDIARARGFWRDYLEAKEHGKAT